MFQRCVETTLELWVPLNHLQFDRPHPTMISVLSVPSDYVWRKFTTFKASYDHVHMIHVSYFHNLQILCIHTIPPIKGSNMRKINCNFYQAADFDEQTEQRACWPGGEKKNCQFSSGWCLAMIPTLTIQNNTPHKFNNMTKIRGSMNIPITLPGHIYKKESPFPHVSFTLNFRGWGKHHPGCDCSSPPGFFYHF